jgi:hypothetical protein
MEEYKTKEEYNEEEVHYCTKCLSLRIRYIQGMSESEYCDSCGSTEIDTTNILDWEDKYQKKYKHPHLDNY